MSAAESPSGNPGLVRLQKFLSDTGIASRRAAEQMILDGRVQVNGRVVAALPAFVDARRDRVVVDGTAVRPRPREYWIVHKPRGVVCGPRDPAGRVRVIDLLPDGHAHVIVVGALDPDSSGLVLLTSDGEFAQRVARRGAGLMKRYRVEVRGDAPPDTAARLHRGVHLMEGRVGAVAVTPLHRSRDRSAFDVTLAEEVHRHNHRLFAKLGLKVVSERRMTYGPLRLVGLPVGACRRLRPDEVRALQNAAARAGGPPTRPARAPVRRSGGQVKSPRRRSAVPHGSAAARQRRIVS